MIAVNDFYLNSYQNYLNNLINDNLNKTNELRIVIQSLMPNQVLSIFSYISENLSREKTFKSYLKVAKGLVSYWNKQPLNNLDHLALKKLEQNDWIDYKDQLTWYRNRTLKDENTDKLLILLAGLDHTTDKGGLSDFFICDDEKIWLSLKNNHLSWISSAFNQVGIMVSDSQLNQLDRYLKQVNTLIPLTLNQRSQLLIDCFHETETINTFEGIMVNFFKVLPKLGIPFLNIENDLKVFESKQGLIHLKSAYEFISHVRYKVPARKKNDYKKITKQLKTLDFKLQDIHGNSYSDLNTYLEKVNQFIFNADLDAKKSLREIDLLPLLKALGLKEEKQKSKSTIPLYRGQSLETIHKGLLYALREYQNDELNINDIEEIKIFVAHFQHDLSDEDSESQDLSKTALAQKILHSALAGIEDQINTLNIGLDSVKINFLPLYQDGHSTFECTFKTTNPVVQFKIELINQDSSENYVFKWAFSEYQIERVHVILAQKILEKLRSREFILPVFAIPSQAFKAIYYATDEQEACRLLSLGLSNLTSYDIFEKFSISSHPRVLELCLELKEEYIKFIQTYLNHGRYVAQSTSYQLTATYTKLCKEIKAINPYDASDIIERLYYSFFIIENRDKFDFKQIDQVLLTGFHPSVIELIQAQSIFITEAIEQNYQTEKLLKFPTFDQIFRLSEIQAPILALRQKQGISTHIKSFSWLHFLGQVPNGELDLVVQALLRDNDIDEDEEVKEIIKKVPEQDIINNILNDYGLVNSHVRNGLRLLAINVFNLPSILSGLQQYLSNTILKDPNAANHYSVQITIYTVGLSRLNAVNALKAWQAYMIDKFSRKDKNLDLKISHFVSSKTNINNDLRFGTSKHLYPWNSYDLAFNFNLLSSQTIGRTEAAPIFEFNSSANRLKIYPIIYYPKPIYSQSEHIRQLLLSNRRIQVQSNHADLTARLEVADRSQSQQYFVLSEARYDENAQDLIQTLHKMAQWIVNIDPFFDHHLLKLNNTNHSHKVISFSSGYGAYGELNVTVSAEKQAYEILRNQIKRHLSANMPFLNSANIPYLVDKINILNEGLSGIASVKAILGDSEIIRNLYGYALAMQAVPLMSDSIIEQWIPLDAFPHWFEGEEYRPDLLKVSLKISEDNHPILYAKVIEAKVGAEIEDLLEKAEAQIEAGLVHLKSLFTPIKESEANAYDSRYWWGQLYRAIILRSQLDRSKISLNNLNIALEKLADGEFDIHWSSEIIICNTGTRHHDVETTEFYFSNDLLHGIEKKYLVHQYSALSFEEVLLSGLDVELTTEEEANKSLISPTITISANHSTDQNTDNATNNNEDTSIENTNSRYVDVTTNSTNESGNISIVAVAVANESTSDQNVFIQNIINSEIDISDDSNELNHNATCNEDAKTLKTEIVFGTTGKLKNPVVWPFNHSQLNNRHMLIFGSSGFGKTYAIQCFLAELASVGLSSFIIDYTNGFLPNHTETIYRDICKPKDYYVALTPLPINPFKAYSSEIAPGIVIPQKSFDVATRVRSILCSVYTDFGSQQQAIIDKVLEQGLEKNDKYSFTDFLNDLEEDTSTQGQTVANKIRSLVKQNSFDAQTENNLYEEQLRKQYPVQVIQLSTIAPDLQKILTEFILWDVWAYAQKYGRKDKPITIVLDEVQNLDHSPDSPIDKLLREGRKFGISLILATQTLSKFNKEQKDRLFLASTKLFFKPAATEVDSFAKLLSQVNSNFSVQKWRDELNKLTKGNCLYLGYVENQQGLLEEKILHLNITTFEARDFKA